MAVFLSFLHYSSALYHHDIQLSTDQHPTAIAVPLTLVEIDVCDKKFSLQIVCAQSFHLTGYLIHEV